MPGVIHLPKGIIETRTKLFRGKTVLDRTRVDIGSSSGVIYCRHITIEG